MKKGGQWKDTSVSGQDESKGGLRGRELLVLFSRAPWNCSVWRYKKSNGRNGRPARAWGEGMNQETAGGILGLMTGAEKQG